MKRLLPLCLLLGAASFNTAQADYFKTLIESDNSLNTKLELGTVVNLAFAKVWNSYYGAGSRDLKNANITRKNPAWMEYSFNPKIKTTTGLPNQSELYAGLSVIGAGAQGRGDASAISTTSEHPFLLDWEEAFIGWRSGKMFKGCDDNFMDFSLGNQSFLVGDGFVIADGTIDGFRRGAFYLGPRTAFRDTAILKINTHPVRGQVFHLRTNTNQRDMKGNDQPNTRMYGANIEYVSRDDKDASKELWTIGAMYLNVYKASNPVNARDGMHLFNLRTGGTFFSFNRDIRFFAGYVHEHNSKSNKKVSANAYYIEPGYTFSNWWAKPLLTYRYTFFSGQKDTTAGAKKKSYDPMNFGFWARDGYGTWETGQIFGTFYFGNTNQQVQNVQLKLFPTDQLTFGVQYYHVDFHKPEQYGATSKHATNEVDLYGTWSPCEKYSFTLIGGASSAGKGIKQAIQSNLGLNKPTGKTTYFASLMATFKF